MMERLCDNCGSNSTYILKSGYPFWVKKSEGTLCKKCYQKLYSAPKHNPKRIRFKPFEGKQIEVEGLTRTNTCKNCGKSVVKGEIKRTNFHHLSYDTTNPSSNVIELCVPCHRRIHPGKRVS